MGDVVLAETPEQAEAVTVWLKKRLKGMGARQVYEFTGHAGSVEATMTKFLLPSGDKLEVWSDNYTALSLSGPDGIVEAMAAEYRKELSHG